MSKILCNISVLYILFLLIYLIILWNVKFSLVCDVGVPDPQVRNSFSMDTESAAVFNAAQVHVLEKSGGWAGS